MGVRNTGAQNGQLGTHRIMQAQHLFIVLARAGQYLLILTIYIEIDNIFDIEIEIEIELALDKIIDIEFETEFNFNIY